MKSYFVIITLVFLSMCPSIQAELIVNDNGTVTDTTTGLMWQQVADGTMTWEEALIHCESMTLADHDDWRMPNRNELASIVDYAKYNPAFDTTVFTGSQFNTSYWSSTTLVDNTAAVWCAAPSHGGFFQLSKTGLIRVRAVRNTQVLG